MVIENLKKHIAETAYNVGYSAKLHFASYEMIEKLPGITSFLSMVIGIYALVIPSLSTKFVSCTLLVFGLVGLYSSIKNSEKAEYYKNGVILTGLFNELKHLMSEVDSSNALDVKQKLIEIEAKYNENCASNHIVFSTWFAHYKFFWEQQIGWIDEQLGFSFLKDKVPLTFWVFFVLIITTLLLSSDVIIAYICESAKT